MKAKGNGEIMQCVENLLSIISGEVPMERVKGINARIYDMPEQTAVPALIEHATWLIETYEPRASMESIKLIAEETSRGNYGLTVAISEYGNY